MALPLKPQSGFTLAELLIALAILGVIAVFAIPKIITAQQNGQNIAKTKEVAGMISGAFQKAKLDGIVSSSTKSVDLMPYMNYIGVDTSGTLIDAPPGAASSTCTSITPCYILHNGGMLWAYSAWFNGTSSTNVIEFRYDPDYSNNTTSTADGPLKAVQFDLYYDGFLTTRSKIKPGTCSSVACPYGAGGDPSWFSW